MSDFYVSNNTRQQVRQKLHFAGDIKTLSVDFSVLADDIGAITGVVASSESGNGTIGTATLASNVWSAPVTTAQAGQTMIKLLASSATNTEAVYIKITCKEPRALAASSDYEMVWG